MSSISPTNVSRVTMLMQSSMFNYGVRNTLVDLLEVQDQLSSGLRINRPSDSPADATTIMHLDSVIEQQEQYLSNMGYADDFLASTDNALGQAVELITEAYTLGIADESEDGRQANALLINEILEQMVSIANTACYDTYIFAGVNRTVIPYDRHAGGVLFQGDISGVETRVAFDNTVSFNVQGNETFGVMSGRVNAAVDLNPDIAGETLLSDLNGALGLGVRLSTITISDGVNSERIDLSGCVTVDDVLNKINTDATLTGATAVIAADDSSIQITTAAGTVSISDVGSGTAAADLGLSTPDWVAGNVLKGQDLDARLSNATLVGALAGGAGIDLTSGLKVSNSLVDPLDVIDLSTAQTVEDILNAINSSDACVKAQISSDGKGIDIINLLSGSALRIGEVGPGGTTAGDLGIRTMTADTPLSALNNGSGIHPESGVDDIRLTDRSGNSCDVNLDTAETIGDVIDLINAAAAAAAPPVQVTAALASDGNGIEFTDTSGGAGDLSITRINDNGYFIDEELGINQSVSSNVLTGEDVNGVTSGDVFSHLIMLRDALNSNDQVEIDRAAVLIDEDRERLSNIRGRAGSQMRAFEDRKARMEDNILATQILRSDIRDIDFTEAITRYQNLQTALEGNLMTGQFLNTVSLLDYLR